MTIDGFCDHTGMDPDEEIHRHYENLLNQGGVILYGRITYDLMKFWQTLAENPSGEKSMDDFAKSMDNIPKIVFSNTLKDTGWNSAKLSNLSLEEEVLELRQQSGKDIYVGSRSLIIQLFNLKLIDELQLCIHPVAIGSGLPLFENLNERTSFKLLKTKTFASGAMISYFKPNNINN